MSLFTINNIYIYIFFLRYLWTRVLNKRFYVVVVVDVGRGVCDITRFVAVDDTKIHLVQFQFQ